MTTFILSLREIIFLVVLLILKINLIRVPYLLKVSTHAVRFACLGESDGTGGSEKVLVKSKEVVMFRANSETQEEMCSSGSVISGNSSIAAPLCVSGISHDMLDVHLDNLTKISCILDEMFQCQSFILFVLDRFNKLIRLILLIYHILNPLTSIFKFVNLPMIPFRILIKTSSYPIL